MALAKFGKEFSDAGLLIAFHDKSKILMLLFSHKDSASSLAPVLRMLFQCKSSFVNTKVIFM